MAESKREFFEGKSCSFVCDWLITNKLDKLLRFLKVSLIISLQKRLVYNIFNSVLGIFGMEFFAV